MANPAVSRREGRVFSCREDGEGQKAWRRTDRQRDLFSALFRRDPQEIPIHRMRRSLDVVGDDKGERDNKEGPWRLAPPGPEGRESRSGHPDLVTLYS